MVDTHYEGSVGLGKAVCKHLNLPVCLFPVPYGDFGQNKRGKAKGIHRCVLKTGMLHIDF